MSSLLFTIGVFIIVIIVIVFIHEFGHFFAAKHVGIRVDEFAIGFPPKMYGKKVGDTEYRLNWLPIGGYVKMAGQDDFKPVQSDGKPWEFYSKSIPQRLYVVIAGPFMNWVLAFVIFWALAIISGVAVISSKVGKVDDAAYWEGVPLEAGDKILMVNGREITKWDDMYSALVQDKKTEITQHFTVEKHATGEVIELSVQAQRDELITTLHPFLGAKVGEVVQGSPAEKAGLLSKDEIISVDGTSVTQWGDLVEIIHSKPNEDLSVVWERNGTSFSEVIHTMEREIQVGEGKQKVGLIGISPHLEKEKIGFFMGFIKGWEQSYQYSKLILVFLGDLIQGKVSAKENLGGPIRIAKMAGESARYGFVNLLFFMALLSINLAVINILPIPMLDGGHAFMFIIEGIRRKSFSFKQRLVIQQVGFVLLMSLMVFVIYNDIANLVGLY